MFPLLRRFEKDFLIVPVRIEDPLWTVALNIPLFFAKLAYVKVHFGYVLSNKSDSVPNWADLLSLVQELNIKLLLHIDLVQYY